MKVLKMNFPLIFEQIQKADILVVGTPVLSGMRSSECQKLIERLQGSHQSHLDPATGQPALYNKLFGLVSHRRCKRGKSMYRPDLPRLPIA